MTSEVLENYEYNLRSPNSFNHFKWCIIFDEASSAECVNKIDSNVYLINDELLEMCNDLFGVRDEHYKIASRKITSKHSSWQSHIEVRVFCNDKTNITMLKLRFS